MGWNADEVNYESMQLHTNKKRVVLLPPKLDKYNVPSSIPLSA
jgi:hypothetical protein